MRQIKIGQLQSKIDKIKKANTYEKACNFIHKHVSWFYDNYEELKRKIIAADMIYKETDAESHSENNYEANIILEVKQYYVFIFYEYDYSHDSYSTRIQIFRKTQNSMPNLKDLAESFVEDAGEYNGDKDDDEYFTYYNIDYRQEYNSKSVDKLISGYNDMLRYVKDSFVKKLAVGLSFQSCWNSVTNNKLQALYKILCYDINDETTKSDTEEVGESCKVDIKEYESEEEEGNESDD